jgi:hypothetical protein
LKSAASIPSGEAPTGIAAASDAKPLLAALRKSTVTEPPLRLVMARSGRPSRLKSAATTSRGPAPVALAAPSAVNPSFAGLRRKVVTFELVRLVAAMSTRPSPLKSAAVTEPVPLTTLTVGSGAKPPLAWRIITLTVPLLKFCVATSG